MSTIPEGPGPRERVAGLVLCGGSSTRMGTDKALIELEGERLVQRVARRLSLVADPVILATGRPGRLGPLGYREVADALPGRGPLSGLVAGLAASPHDLVAAVAVDMPFASPETLRLLASLHEGEDAVVPLSADGLEPLHAVYSRSALSSLRSDLEKEELSLRKALAGLRIRAVGEREWRETDPSGRFAQNINSLQDVIALGLRQHVGSSRRGLQSPPGS